MSAMASTTGPYDKDPANPEVPTQKPTQQRTRTGCLTCRKRRRKCDEGKPNCRNCLGKNLQCKYGVQLSYLPGNALSLDQSPVVPAQKRHRLPRELRLQDYHVNAESSERDDTKAYQPVPEHLSRQFDVSDTHSGHASPGLSDLPPFANYEAFNHNHGSALHFETRNEHPCVGDDVTVSKSYIGQTPNAADQISYAPGAVSSLESHKRPVYQSYQLRSSVQSDGLDFGAYAEIAAHEANLSAIHSSLALSERPQIEGKKRLEILRYYRYHVAPWLDLVDNRSPFGLLPYPLLEQSELLDCSLVALAFYHRSMGTAKQNDDSVDAARCVNYCRTVTEYGIDAQASLLSTLYQTAVLFLSSPPEQWLQAAGPYQSRLDKLSSYAFSHSMAGSVFWSHFRFDLAKALASNTPTTLGLAQLARISSTLGFYRLSHLDQGYLTHYFNTLLIIAAKVLHVKHFYNINSTSNKAGSSAVLWKDTWQALSDWSAECPEELQPLFERTSFSVHDDLPVVVFTTGLATLATQLYHALLFLLLQCKPRIVIISSEDNMVVSTLWHAKMVCAIVTCNRENSDWDLLTIPLVEITAKRMTHETQQVPILQILARMRDEMGWKVQGVIDRLTSTWALDHT